MTRQLLILSGLIAAIVPALMTAQAPAPERRVVRIRAERFHFTPSEIQLKQGEEVDLRLKSDDTAHGFRISGPDTDIVIPKRGKGEVTVTFVAKAPGRYEFECSQMCGAGHSYMRGVIIVKPTVADERSGR
jgi:cytochrome c oxidase subunit 2